MLPTEIDETRARESQRIGPPPEQSFVDGRHGLAPGALQEDLRDGLYG